MCKADGCAVTKLKAFGLCNTHYMRLKRQGSTADPLPRPVNYCSTSGCAKACKGDGLCEKHYMRQYRHGDPETTLYQRDAGPDETRWLAKVEVQSPGCWVWQTGLSNGYGSYSPGGKSKQAHIYVYELLVGPVPEGLELDHLCRVTACVNPDHLEPVTHLVNVHRGASGPGKQLGKKLSLIHI